MSWKYLLAGIGLGLSIASLVSIHKKYAEETAQSKLEEAVAIY